VRAYEPVIQDAPIQTFHDLRAEAKRMRYALEFFRDVLGLKRATWSRCWSAFRITLGAAKMPISLRS